MFYVQVSQLTWIERRVAATLFSAPPTSTPKEALEYFKKSENLKPFMDNRFFMAKCYMALGNNQQALKWLDAASAMPAHTASVRLQLYFTTTFYINTFSICK